MTIKEFKSAFLRLSDDEKIVAIAKIKSAIDQNAVKPKELFKLKVILEWCKVRVAAQPDLSFINSKPKKK